MSIPSWEVSQGVQNALSQRKAARDAGEGFAVILLYVVPYLPILAPAAAIAYGVWSDTQKLLSWHPLFSILASVTAFFVAATFVTLLFASIPKLIWAFVGAAGGGWLGFRIAQGNGLDLIWSVAIACVSAAIVAGWFAALARGCWLFVNIGSEGAPRSKLVMGGISAALFAVLAGAFLLFDVSSRLSEADGIILARPGDGDYERAPGEPPISVEVKRQSIVQLAKLFDDKLSTQTTNGQRVRRELESFSKEIGREDAFKDFTAKLDIEWKIHANKSNTVVDAPDALQWSYVLALYKPTIDLVARLQTSPKYLSLKGKYPAARELLDAQPQTTSLIHLTYRNPASAFSATVAAYKNNADTKSLAEFLPDENGKPSRPYQLLRAVNERVRAFGGEIILVGMTDELGMALSRGIDNNDVIGHACEASRLWLLTWSGVTRYQQQPNHKWATAVAAVSVDMGNDVQATLDNALAAWRAAAPVLKSRKSRRFSCE